MSNEKRYERMLQVIKEAAKRGEPGMFDMQDGDYYRVTVERIEPEPDAEAEKRWWACFWDRKSGYQSKYPDRWGKERIAVEFAGGDLWQAQGIIHSATEPTFAEFAAAVKDATGVEIPVPEEPHWWVIADVPDANWVKAKKPEVNEDCVVIRMSPPLAYVYGVESERDALLAAAREAGKP